MSVVKVPQLAWYEPAELELSFPDTWKVETYNYPGYDSPELKSTEIKAAINKPLGTPRLSEMAKGKKQVAILFDDETRVTRAAKIAPHILAELKAGGIPDENIRFICGLGLHGAAWRQFFVKKLGEEIVSKYPVYNHYPFDLCTYCGTTKTFKTRVYANMEYMKCDLKVAIGSVVPHPSAGFGGGGKMILPGVTSFETIDWNHHMGRITGQQSPTPIHGMGLHDNNLLRRDIDEVADLVGLDFLVNALVNSWGESTAIYAGEMHQVHTAAVAQAKKHYLTPRVKDKDIVIANTYAKVNEATIGLSIAFKALSEKGGDVVLVMNCPGGFVTHYLGGPFGKTTWARQHFGAALPKNVNHLIVYNEYPDPGASWIEEDERVINVTKWDDVLALLNQYHGSGAQVAVYPNAEIQYSL